MSITKTKDPLRILKKIYQRPCPWAPPSVLRISCNLRRDRISKTIPGKVDDLCDHDNYF